MSAVGFIGLGQIGAPMAAHLLDWPDGLVVYDVRPEATAPFSSKGAVVASSAAEVADRAEVVSLMVRDDDQVREVCREIVATSRSSVVVAVHSTIRPGTAELLSDESAASGVDIVDAPVSGGFMGASEGSLAVMVGGEEEPVERCGPVFSCWASLIVHAGPAGAGTKAKLARNLLTFAGYAAAAEAQRLAEAAGIDLGELAKVVRHSDRVTGGPGAIMLRDTTASMKPEDPLYEILSHTRELGEKDLALAIDLGEELGVDLPFAKLALERLGQGLGLSS
jgi:3-hydroxyisobutyrate dehydrogenase-like beta-hydroxyacid dehydrogenase